MEMIEKRDNSLAMSFNSSQESSIKNINSTETVNNQETNIENLDFIIVSSYNNNYFPHVCVAIFAFIIVSGFI